MQISRANEKQPARENWFAAPSDGRALRGMREARDNGRAALSTCARSLLRSDHQRADGASLSARKRAVFERRVLSITGGLALMDRLSRTSRSIR